MKPHQYMLYGFAVMQGFLALIGLQALFDTQKWGASWVVLVMLGTTFSLIWAAEKGVDQSSLWKNNDRTRHDQ